MIKITVLFTLLALGLCQVDQVCHKVGEDCGGVRQTKCCLGQQLRCHYQTPIHPEANGVCEKVCSVEEDICGGFTLDPQVCCSGLKCVQVNKDIPDLPGRCRNSTDA